MSALFAFIANFTALLVLAVFSRRLWRNLRFLHRARESGTLPAVLPRVSVLVPARNEARTIVSCVESLAYQNYPDFEIIMLDDQSSDETGILLDELAARYAHVTVLHGTENPPAGWNGKSYACHRLAEHATGEWLLFTDADTLHSPASITHGISQARQLDVDLLSAFPNQITESWSERIVVSFILDFLPMVAADLQTQGDTGSVVAIGQYLLTRANTYRATGGHQAIADALVDDFALARRFQSEGYKVALVDGTSMLRCRMYRSAGEVWQGFSKNILLGLQTSSSGARGWWGMAFAWGYACVFVLPFLLLFTSYRKSSVLVIGWMALLRGVVSWRFARPLTEVITTPLAAWSVMLFGLRAFLSRKRGKPIRWKDRDYPLTG